MGGKGETTSYTRLRAKTEARRNEIKQEIMDIIDNATTPISVIALVEEPEDEGGTNKKKKKKKKKKKY
jgi:hypothetical protein